MIQYYLEDTLINISGSSAAKPLPTVTVMSSAEYNQSFEGTDHHRMLKTSLSHIHYCKADIMGNFVTGTFLLPSKEILSRERLAFGFYMSESELIFVDDEDLCVSVLEELKAFPITEAGSVLNFLYAFMEYLIKDDVYFLQHFEETLTKLEEQILDNHSSDFNQRILQTRKKLASLSSYYEQLQDMGESLQQNPFQQENDKNSRLFGLFANRAGRLYSNVQMLKDYSMQLRELHQTQVDMRQNQIMKFLTIVTTIFMPLSLIAGWYGMNFVHMPELNSPYGYVIICIVSILIVAVEIWLFKIKHWFD